MLSLFSGNSYSRFLVGSCLLLMIRMGNYLVRSKIIFTRSLLVVRKLYVLRLCFKLGIPCTVHAMDSVYYLDKMFLSFSVNGVYV